MEGSAWAAKVSINARRCAAVRRGWSQLSNRAPEGCDPFVPVAFPFSARRPAWMELAIPCSQWLLKTTVASLNGMDALMISKCAPSTAKTGDAPASFERRMARLSNVSLPCLSSCFD